jgi:GT2 family glycosyltransferase
LQLETVILNKKTLISHCSILIVNWNSWELVSQCLDALMNQTYRNFKIFVADNASNDTPPDDIFSTFPNLVFVKNDVNYGFAEANNRLLKLANDSEWIVLLNPDAFPEPDWLEQLIKAANDYPDYSIFGTRLLMAENPERLDGDGDSYHISGLAWRRGHNNLSGCDITPKEIFSPCAAAAMYRTKVMLDAGGFDEDFFCYFEDVDLGFRMRLQGHKCLLVPTATVYHIGSATTGGQKSDFSVYHGHRNLVWTYIKNMPGMLFWLLLPYHILLNIFTISWFVLRGQGSVIFRAKWDAMMGVPHMWRKRKVIQSNRTASIKDIWRVMDKRLIPWNCRH